MEILIALAAFFGSLLTLFSGFGLGTILAPVFGLFFPIQTAIALTGVVHLLNNLFKISLFRREIDRPTVWRFGLPSVVGGLAGAAVLVWLGRSEPLFSYDFFGKKVAEVTPLKLVVAFLMLFFSMMELLPSLKKLRFDAQFLTLGGLASGFFGGLSGHQGALRSAFLSSAGLSKNGFIASGVAIACMVDLARLPVYWQRFLENDLEKEGKLIALATAAAFAGAFLGTKLLKKTTHAAVQKLTAGLIFLFAAALAAGLI